MEYFKLFNMNAYITIGRWMECGSILKRSLFHVILVGISNTRSTHDVLLPCYTTFNPPHPLISNGSLYVL